MIGGHPAPTGSASAAGSEPSLFLAPYRGSQRGFQILCGAMAASLVEQHHQSPRILIFRTARIDLVLAAVLLEGGGEDRSLFRIGNMSERHRNPRRSSLSTL